MNDWQKLGTLAIWVILNVALAVAALFLIERTLEGALKAVKVALKGEFTTDVGRLNLAGMVVFVVLAIVFHLHEAFAKLLIEDNPTAWDVGVLAPVTLFGLLFIGSLICVAVVETAKKK